MPRFRLLLILSVALIVGPAEAQVAPSAPNQDQQSPAEEDVAADPLGRTTPRSMLTGLIEALAARDLERAAAYLDLSGLPEGASDATVYASALEAVLDRSGTILPRLMLSLEPDGRGDDGLPPGVDAFAEIEAGGQRIALTAHRVAGPEENQMIWLVTPETMRKVRALAFATPTGLVDRMMMRGTWSQVEIAGVPLGHWAALMASAIAALLIAALFMELTLFLAAVIWRSTVAPKRGVLRRAVVLPAGVFLACFIFSESIASLGISIVARAKVAPIVEIVAYLAMAVLAWRAVGALTGLWLGTMTRRGRLGAISIVTLVRRLGKILVGSVVALSILDVLGINLTGWLAAFGLGGLAIALGAQKTIEHFVGSVTLVADRPVRTGDFCRVDGLLGTVEDIGMRSTRLRTLDRTLVTIPNGLMSSARIENFASRDRFLFRCVLSLVYGTSPDQMRAVLRRLRGLLESDVRVADDPRRVRFISFGPSSLDVEIFAYVVAEDYNAFLAIAEELNFAILSIVPECGTAFAFPTQTVYLENTRDEAPAEAG